MKKINNDKLMFILSRVLMVFFVSMLIGFGFAAEYMAVDEVIEWLFIGSGIFLVLIGVALVSEIDRQIGYFECPECKEKFNPSLKEYVLGPHYFGTRKLKCPKCEKKSFCKHRLQK